jgi:DNA excision repair protein ERCC-2
MSAKRVVSLSVHELVDFLLRRGDIDNRVYNQETMLVGTKIHASFQKKQGREYLSEIPLAEDFEREEAIVSLEGRADGIILGGPFPVIDEIKSTVEPLARFYAEQKEWHFGQAECYALMYAHTIKAEKVGVRLTYISQLDGSEMVKEKVFALRELEQDIEGLMDRYLALAKAEFTHLEARNKSARALPFPYQFFREGQREMAKYVYSVSTQGGTFFCEAPTGIGKTMSSLYPAVKAFAKTDNSKIFYLTAKSSGREAACDALNRLFEKGLVARDSVLTAKDKICFSLGKSCNPDECPFAKDYYGKIRKVTEEALKTDARLDYRRITELARHYAMCPFELQLDLSLWSDIIFCDYNYFFDPLVKLERYFDETVDSSHYIVLVDEAHNLVERGRDMYSSSFSAAECERAKAKIRSFKTPKLKKALSRLDKALRDLDLSHPEEAVDFASIPPEVTKSLEALTTQSRTLEATEHPALPNEFKDVSREAYRFAFLSENYPEHAHIYGEREGSDYRLHLYCLDPSPMLAASLAKVKGRAIFSATLSPMDYYMDAICGNHDDPFLLLPSPFPKENFDLILAPLVSIRYKDRSKTYAEVATYLSAFVAGKKGNYFLYFPSYEYLEKIQPFLSFGDSAVFTQEKDMSDDEKSLFLSRFLSDPPLTTVGLLVIGGSFAEGVDLADGRLTGVAVVGIGLPQLSHERDLIRDYFDKINGKGYDYAYMNPGMNKVMQAVGRLIRSERDKGAALLVDDRYLQGDYRDLFARTWPGYTVATCPEDVTSSLENFYNEAKK